MEPLNSTDKKNKGGGKKRKGGEKRVLKSHMRCLSAVDEALK
jgi:hypothetical protein